MENYPIFNTFYCLTKEEDDKVKGYLLELAKWIDGRELLVES